MTYSSLRKTSIILDAVERKKLRVTYYALDLDQKELERSLSSLGQFQYVNLVGLLGTYDQGIPWLSQKFASNSPPTHKMIMWLGSSIGNENRQESAVFLRRLQQTCMQPGDLLLLGFDERDRPEKIKLAYDDTQGVTREFIMNGLDHVNAILGQNVFDRSKFDYDSRYQEHIGRHVAHYRAKEDMDLMYERPHQQGAVQILVKKDELIHIEYSYKYSRAEISHMLTAAGLDTVEDWEDTKDNYVLLLAECRPFMFERDIVGVRDTLFPRKKAPSDEIQCSSCNVDYIGPVPGEHDARPESLVNIVGSRYWPSYVPSLHEWQQLWRSWDLVTRTMLNHETMLFERPIALRHPFIFYLGHIPAFLDIQLSRHEADKELNLGTALTEPVEFADIFERGIDPDMDDPTQCNPHSEVPDSEDGWPNVDSILLYQQKIRNRLQRLLLQWESEEYNDQDWKAKLGRRRAARVVWMCFEHEAMHLETLLYMLLQCDNIHPPKDVALPPWKMAMKSDAYATCAVSHTDFLKPAPFAKIPSGTVTLGHNDREEDDFNDLEGTSIEFGWDNENPQRTVSVNEFEIQTRPVTNAEYLRFLRETNSSALPASWRQDENGDIFVRTAFGPCPLSVAMHWPAQVCYNEAAKYAKHYSLRIPTEPELMRFRDYVGKDETIPKKIANIGFAAWHPTDVNNEEYHVLGDVWEWTSTTWDAYPGFIQSKLYPGYSADFFDGKHNVILGGSWATHPRMAERWSFRNWYQTGYPYVFSGFRCCRLA